MARGSRGLDSEVQCDHRDGPEAQGGCEHAALSQCACPDSVGRYSVGTAMRPPQAADSDMASARSAHAAGAGSAGLGPSPRRGSHGDSDGPYWHGPARAARAGEAAGDDPKWERA